MTKPETKSAPAVGRAAAILRLLSRSAEPLGVNAIARELGFVPSTCLHVLRALAQEGLVALDPATRRYVLGMEILTLARRMLRQSRFATIAQPFLVDLAATHRLTALGVTLELPNHMVVVALERSSAALIHIEIGSRLPILLSATGRCYAAVSGLSADRLRRRFDRLDWDRQPAWADWLREVDEARRTGYAVDRGNNIRGVTVLAAPVFERPGDMTHAVALLLVSDQLESDREARIAADLRRSTETISERLGGIPS